MFCSTGNLRNPKNAQWQVSIFIELLTCYRLFIRYLNSRTLTNVCTNSRFTCISWNCKLQTLKTLHFHGSKILSLSFQLFCPNCVGYFLMALFSYSVQTVLDTSKWHFSVILSKLCWIFHGTFQLFCPNCVGYFLMALCSYSVQTVLDTS